MIASNKWVSGRGADVHRPEKLWEYETAQTTEQGGRERVDPSPSINKPLKEREINVLLPEAFPHFLPLAMLSKMIPLSSPGPTGFQWWLPVFPVEIRNKCWKQYPNSPETEVTHYETLWRQGISWNWAGHPKSSHFSGSQKSPAALLNHFIPYILLRSGSSWCVTGPKRPICLPPCQCLYSLPAPGVNWWNSGIGDITGVVDNDPLYQPVKSTPSLLRQLFFFFSLLSTTSSPPLSLGIRRPRGSREFAYLTHLWSHCPFCGCATKKESYKPDEEHGTWAKGFS